MYRKEVGMDLFSERRLAENELLFRHANEKNEGRQKRATFATDAELVLGFFCECSNRNCHEKIHLSVEEYEKVHQNNKQFIALPNHENKTIEEVVNRRDGYNVIQKFVDPAEALARA
jgi:hypothetical protein